MKRYANDSWMGPRLARADKYPVTAEHAEILDQIALREQEIHDTGWSERSSLLRVTEVNGEPVVATILTQEGHPVDVMIAAYKLGLNLGEHDLGLGIVAEGYRHLEAAELREREDLKPTYDRALTMGRMVFSALGQDDGLTDDEVVDKVLLPMRMTVNAKDLKPDERADDRFVVVYLKTGKVLTYVRTGSDGRHDRIVSAQVDLAADETARGAWNSALMNSALAAMARGLDPDPRKR